jgi:hypothetical protein
MSSNRVRDEPGTGEGQVQTSRTTSDATPKAESTLPTARTTASNCLTAVVGTDGARAAIADRGR